MAFYSLFDLPQRIQDKIMPEPMSGCWLWIGALRDDGYGKIEVRGKEFRIHRLVYCLFSGIEPSLDFVVRHKCDIRICCNPCHLVSGTHEENVADRVERKRSAIGSLNGRSKLTPDDVRSIRADSRTDIDIAKDFGVVPKTIYDIKRNRIWQSIS